MPKECKKYRMRSTRRPARNPLLSSVVRVIDETGKSGYCYIGFDAPLIELVGKKLSRGVAPYDPAYLSVEYDRIGQVWIVAARYLLTPEQVAILWSTPAKPEWLTIYFGGNDGNKNGPAARGGSRTGCQTGQDGSAGSSSRAGETTDIGCTERG